jgi:hypothetical protein
VPQALQRPRGLRLPPCRPRRHHATTTTGRDHHHVRRPKNGNWRGRTGSRYSRIRRAVNARGSAAAPSSTPRTACGSRSREVLVKR